MRAGRRAKRNRVGCKRQTLRERERERERESFETISATFMHINCLNESLNYPVLRMLPIRCLQVSVSVCLAVCLSVLPA